MSPTFRGRFRGQPRPRPISVDLAVQGRDGAGVGRRSAPGAPYGAVSPGVSSGACATMSCKSDWVNSAIAASAVLAGSGLTAFVTSRAAKRHAAGQERSELVAALQAYGYAVTNLG